MISYNVTKSPKSNQLTKPKIQKIKEIKKETGPKEKKRKKKERNITWYEAHHSIRSTAYKR